MTKKSSDYDDELVYELELVEGIGRKPGGRDVARTLIEFIELIASGKLDEKTRAGRVRELAGMVAEIHPDMPGYATWRLLFIETLLNDERKPQRFTELVAEHVPQLACYTTITLTELRRCLIEVKAIRENE
jgi:hypothetical protein